MLQEKDTNMHLIIKSLTLVLVLVANRGFSVPTNSIAHFGMNKISNLSKRPACLAGTNSPNLLDSSNFIALSNTYTIPCGLDIADLSTLNASNLPAGTVLTVHSNILPSESNKVTSIRSIVAGSYYITFFDPRENCYSTSTQITVALETNCPVVCSTALPITTTSPNSASNAVSKCPAKYNKQGQIMYFPWVGNITDGQTATISEAGVTYTASVSNYTGTNDVVFAEDLDSHIWVGAKIKHMYSDGNSGQNEGWYMASNTYGDHSWMVTITATHNASGLQFPVNILAYDLESTSGNESVTIQAIDGSSWDLFEQYEGTCSNATNNGLGNIGQGTLTGVGNTRITYTETEHSGGNSIWVSKNASKVFLNIKSGGGKQGVGVALLLDPDTDGDGIPDKYETAISGFVKDDLGTALANTTVKLFDENNTEIQSTTTDANGFYSFTNLQAGVFTVQENDLPGYNSISSNSISNIRTKLGSETCNINFVDQIIITPIELVHFSAEKINQDIQLTWSTASEVNNKLFILEYSNDGVNFTHLSIVKAENNRTNHNQNYSVIHDNVHLLGFDYIYYRLSQIDTNNKINHIEKILAIELTQTNTDLLVYPIPAPKGKPIIISGFKNNEQYYIYNIYGKLILSGKLNGNNFKIQTNKFNKGSYRLVLSRGKAIHFIIQ